MEKKNGFDKFMKDIVRREQDRRPVERTSDEQEETMQRQYRRRYAEKWQNRIKYTTRGNRG